MFTNTTLQNHLESSSTVRLQSAVIAEWNMNIAENIAQVGNYRFRPTNENSLYYRIAASFSYDDEGNFYTGATDADIIIDGGYDDDGTPIAFISSKQKEAMLYSLEDCFGRFRPRSGINKLRYFENKYSHNDNIFMSQRPRYYMADKKDTFKYWSSYRTEDGIERGIASNVVNNRNYIDDAAPYVVYKNQVPANRIVVKVQTNTGNIDLGPFSSSGGAYDDPFYGEANRTVPLIWKIQYLSGDNWFDAMEFNEESVRRDGSAIFDSDGYLEVGYGLIIPEDYYSTFRYEKEFASSSLLPSATDLTDGTAYLVRNNSDIRGTVYIAQSGSYETFTATYGWQIIDDVNRSVSFVTDLTSPASFTDDISNETVYREFRYLDGLRIVVETMNVFESTLDLLELSPRLTVDLSDKVTEFGIKKSASDLGVSGLPVGQLLASTGTLNLFDYDQAFYEENTSSIISSYLSQNIQIKLYEIVIDVNGVDYFVPIKTMYTEGFPKINNKDRAVTIEMRDLFFYLESTTAPQILVQNVSLSYAVSLLLDSVGFSNYVFRRNENETEEIIPYFFIEPDKSIAEVLNSLARSTQSAMFFDEYNNFIVMSKGYMMPTSTERATDLTLYGSKDFTDTGVLKNSQDNATLANIVGLAYQDNGIYNDGKIIYSTRYLQRSYGSIRQASLLERDKAWIYKPALLWEVTSNESLRSTNEEVMEQSAYSLAAVPLNSDLSADVPTVENHLVTNNVIDLGEGIYWLTRYTGYFYANGEIIKYDAVQYNIPGLSSTEQDGENGDNVWISSLREYQRYFAKVPFNGKIYPTGLVRIYSEPNYETNGGVTKLQNGAVAKHGRGQFGTDIVSHSAGLNSYWSDNNNVRGINMSSTYLFGTETAPSTSVGVAGQSNANAASTDRAGVIKNFLADQSIHEANNALSYPATIQSSAFVVNGPGGAGSIESRNFVSYIYKPLENRFRHFGTRVRIVGQLEDSDIKNQTPNGASTYYTLSNIGTNQDVTIAGGSGGLAILLNSENNNGYFFEIAALTAANISDYEEENQVADAFFYKVKRDSSATSDSDPAIPVKLWSGIGNFTVDDGTFVGQSRLAAETNTTVYDLAVEYEDIGGIRRFYLYINNINVAIIDDDDPLPTYTNMALFVRGGARLMFENIYALTENYSQNATFAIDAPVKSIFNAEDLDANQALQKYAVSGLVQSTFLSGVGPSEPPKYNIYYEEFGTIMREAAYFNVRYDKAYPALSAKISPTFNRVRGYSVSGFRASSYGAEFLIFNNTDSALNLDSSSGNYLRIQGVTFTQQSNHELSVDEYFNRIGNLSDPAIVGDTVILPPEKTIEKYQNIKFSRLTQGRKEFTIEAPYIQSQESADNLMQWLASRVMKNRMAAGVEIFGMPLLQLGDIVEVSYTNENGASELGTGSRFVVYYIDYNRNQEGPSMTAYISEVTE